MYHAKKLKLSQYKDLVISVLKYFTTYTIDSTSQRENHHVDAMASTAFLVSPKFGQDEYHFLVQVLHSPIVTDQTQFDSFMCAHIDLGEWFTHVYNYLKTGSFPDDTNKSLCIRIGKLVARYILLSNVLY